MRIDIRDNRTLILLGTGILFLLILLIFIIPGYKKIGLLKKRAMVYEHSITKMLLMEKELKVLKRKHPDMASRSSEKFYLTTFLVQLARDKGIQDRVAMMNELKSVPDGLNVDGVKDMVEVKLRGIQLTPLTSFLYDIENSLYSLNITKIHLKQQPDNSSVLDVVFLVGYYGEPENTK